MNSMLQSKIKNIKPILSTLITLEPCLQRFKVLHISLVPMTILSIPLTFAESASVTLFPCSEWTGTSSRCLNISSAFAPSVTNLFPLSAVPSSFPQFLLCLSPPFTIPHEVFLILSSSSFRSSSLRYSSSSIPSLWI